MASAMDFAFLAVFAFQKCAPATTIDEPLALSATTTDARPSQHPRDLIQHRVSRSGASIAEVLFDESEDRLE